VVQSLSMLRHLYSEGWEAFLGNAGAIILVSSAVDPYEVAEIVASYVRHHQIAADQLAGSHRTDCRGASLRWHLRVAHGLEITDYRARWQLDCAALFGAALDDGQGDRFRGFGRRRAAMEPSPPATERPVTRRRVADRGARRHNTPRCWAACPYTYAAASMPFPADRRPVRNGEREKMNRNSAHLVMAP
jgi:hypothetical protein